MPKTRLTLLLADPSIKLKRVVAKALRDLKYCKLILETDI